MRDWPKSQRQREVLGLLLRGLSEKEIAAELGIACATVHQHVAAVYGHYQVSSRAELMSLFVADRAANGEAPVG